MLKLLKPLGVLLGTSQVERNSIDTSGHAFEDACQNSLAILVVFLASKVMIIYHTACWVEGAED